MSAQHSLMGRALDRLSEACVGVAMLLLVLIATLVVAQVVARNLFSTGLPWADEAARFAGLSMVYLATPYLLFHGQHVAVTMLAEALSGLKQTVCLALGELATLGFCTLTLYGFYRFLLRAGRFASPALGIPNLWLYMPALVSIVLLAVISLYRLGRLARGRDSTCP
ncbi:TRAP transporter small permease [Vreelandella malpeensis]|uniref:TRAP transporter small permease protein n=1 Tax=Vreelandella malpeensis TaxID=1172368 RepID=A0ABS8DUB3_9GAMM|nr:TRAP transporter small permease [Halomonas malpeensis]MCB8889648.1 TRAP transporter small permease [Halomonas malpeensis]